MQIPRYQPVRKLGFNMTPMIDVVFLLIIFFLVSSHLQRQETQQELDLPVATSADEDINPEIETPRVTINVMDNGELYVSGRPLPRAELVAMLQSVRSEKGEDVEVRIRSSRSAPWSLIEPIMLSCTKSGIWNVGFAVYRSEDG